MSAAPGSANGGTVADAPSPAQQHEFKHTAIHGRLNQYTSGYWALALPALSARYAFEAVTNMAPKFKNWYANSVGLFMMGVTSLYSWRTYKDMRELFAEPLAQEFDKKPKEVGFGDILKSENLLVKQARHNFFNYNARRFGVNSVFFSPYVLPHSIQPSTDNAVKLGIAANAVHLMNDVLGRKETFFERLQSFIDQKINHKDRVGDVIAATDLINLYYRHTLDMDSKFKHPRMNSQEWKDDEKVFRRMADLMNQTYGNTEVKEQADLTVDKFIYLVGMGLLDSDNPEKNLAMVEMANRDGIPAVKRAARGQPAGALPASMAAEAETKPSFTEKLAAENRGKMLNFKESIAPRGAGETPYITA